jgi:hypothetical protein
MPTVRPISVVRLVTHKGSRVNHLVKGTVDFGRSVYLVDTHDVFCVLTWCKVVRFELGDDRS